MDIKDCSVEFHYSFRSGLGCYEEGRFVREVFVQICLSDEQGNTIEEIGNLKSLIIYIDQVYDSPFSIVDVLDAHSEYLARHIFHIYDVENEEFDEKINNYYQHNFNNNNICLIQDIRIVPKYRGYKIGAKAIKDLIFHYSSACGLFAIQPYPLQFETDSKVKANTELELDKFEKDKVKAFKKLTNYYKKIGFESIKGIKDLLFYNPALNNEKLDQIDLEDYNIFN